MAGKFYGVYRVGKKVRSLDLEENTHRLAELKLDELFALEFEVYLLENKKLEKQMIKEIDARLHCRFLYAKIKERNAMKTILETPEIVRKTMTQYLGENNVFQSNE